MTIILGLRSKHDAAAALLVDGEIVAAAAEERFQRRKHYFGFPEHAVRYVLAEAGIAPHQVDLVARDGLPVKKALKRLLQQPRYAWTPRLYREVFDASVTRYVRRNLDVRGSEVQRLVDLGIRPNWSYVEHHAGHAAYAYYAAGWKDATVAVLDGRGHYLAGAFFRGRFGEMEQVGEIQAEGGSLGLFYSAVTDALGFQVGDGDGKTMGLACYGNPEVALADLERFAPRIAGLRSLRWKEWQLDTEVIEGRLHAHYREGALLRLLIDKHGAANVAAAAQHILENRMCSIVDNAVALTGVRDLIGGGGVFLNVKATKLLIDKGIVDNVFVPPGPGDEGLAAGYAMVAYAGLNGGQAPLPLRSAYLGPGYGEDEIAGAIDSTEGVIAERPVDFVAEVADLLVDRQVIGWFQGRMEFGPRALGGRSVLADPRDPEMRDHINDKLKKRDWFMPFAPSVLKEYCDECFVNYRSSPYMNLAFGVKPPYDRSVPAIMHIDATARPQEVDRNTNPLYYAVIDAFRARTGIPMVLNTSFNRHGLPIVCTPKDALDHLRWGSIDVLAIGPFIVRRSGPAMPFDASERAAADAAID